MLDLFLSRDKPDSHRDRAAGWAFRFHLSAVVGTGAVSS
ncbi:MAG TPA: hypothetical protein DEB17_00465 [Chlorobaculum sp.]|uniref:Uncharacterized protein n=1 Tax=Chlorobaculum tepidum (strain ATCC 49652 / DSM 12025 / NBRC 103806 / TLS) TaxID=194439 RepID=Q8KC11_CHLTE|nr:hypothetical protein CT1619 [Chlorobaculum tepidum TLS]HBU22472.1 hypothetical protein [Chlorobaculum sp.]